ncbi:hypothetical protein OESDEN_18454 [Oesophagostomum dentatum]|uniref:G-protein coupled receptors family 1 profile domain-containing protein n=1 Tax=Oesophagostomum dentatum TaxID=61180 RepID=A0A0B1SE78_OESDE|nr:hypothetical protein OESDEN_18454 [Oesophagostomum dentatum]
MGIPTNSVYARAVNWYQMTNATATAIRSNEDIFVSGILAVIGGFGLMSNCIAMVAARRNPVLRNAFGMLCFSHSIANFGVMVVFVFWVTPMTLLQSHLSTELPGKVMGQILIMFWDVCVYSHLLISVNRIVAITLPHQASTLFNIRRTGFMLAAVWTLGFCHIIPYFWGGFHQHVKLKPR